MHHGGKDAEPDDDQYRRHDCAKHSQAVAVEYIAHDLRSSDLNIVRMWFLNVCGEAKMTYQGGIGKDK